MVPSFWKQTFKLGSDEFYLPRWCQWIDPHPVRIQRTGSERHRLDRPEIGMCGARQRSAGNETFLIELVNFFCLRLSKRERLGGETQRQPIISLFLICPASATPTNGVYHAHQWCPPPLTDVVLLWSFDHTNNNNSLSCSTITTAVLCNNQSPFLRHGVNQN